MVQGARGKLGKTPLINAVFRAKNPTLTSDDHATQHDIDQELACDDNYPLILNDSQGGARKGSSKTHQQTRPRGLAGFSWFFELWMLWISKNHQKPAKPLVKFPDAGYMLFGCTARFPSLEAEFYSEEMKYSSRTTPTRPRLLPHSLSTVLVRSLDTSTTE
ncbi:hypothetical protein BS47DRAFT_1030587 [Hydnum rufescens UP504]|uniref:Uncharacterized protein n=1 Tax=Hydnum rufescens UP504 TaxID=1448309 RepID=A0A9P6AVU0_9AGAM|nr:hypothetical protein BS47DRAFT_1030587 [Hydnum rufescens UP504]